MLSKKNIIYLSIVILIIIACFNISNIKSIYNNIKNIINVNLLGDSTIANKNFHIDDISSIEKIILEDRFGNKIVLKKTNKKWIVNDKYKVRSDAMTTLLSSAKEIRIKSPVAKKSIKMLLILLKHQALKSISLIQQIWSNLILSDHLLLII